MTALGLLLYDVLSPKIDRSKDLGEKLPKFSGISLLLTILSLVVAIFVSLPYMTGEISF
jgi:hypothetical protein